MSILHKEAAAAAVAETCTDLNGQISSATCLLRPPLDATAAVGLTRLLLPPQGDRMDREAMKCQVLTVSNHSCESLTLVGNTLECTVPTELQATSSKELQVEVSARDSSPTPFDVASHNTA